MDRPARSFREFEGGSAMKRSGAARVFLALGFILVFFLGLVSVIGIKSTSESDPSRDKSPSGYSFLRRFLGRLGYSPQLRRDPASLWKSAGAVLLFEYPEWDEKTWDDFHEWLDSGGTAVCLGGAENQWMEGLSYGPGSGAHLKGSHAQGVAPGFDFEYSGLVFKALPEEAAVLALSGSDAVLATVRYGRGTMVLGADPELFSNEAMKSGGEEYAVLVNEVFKPAYKRPIFFYSKGEGAGPVSDPIQALFRGRFLPFTLQALAACAALALAIGFRFGAPLPWNGRARRASLEHVNAVGRFFLRAGAAGQAEASNAAYFRHALRALLRAGADSSDQALALAAAERLSGRAKHARYDATALLGLIDSQTNTSDNEMRRRSDERAAILEALERSSA
jgi:hypothetical protein